MAAAAVEAVEGSAARARPLLPLGLRLLALVAVLGRFLGSGRVEQQQGRKRVVQQQGI